MMNAYQEDDQIIHWQQLTIRAYKKYSSSRQVTLEITVIFTMTLDNDYPYIYQMFLYLHVSDTLLVITNS